MFDEYFYIEIVLYLFSGPSSINPETNKQYGSSFPILSVEDFVRAQFQLVKYLGIEKVCTRIVFSSMIISIFRLTKLHASIGSSLGGMCSILSALLYPENIGR